MCYPQRVEVRNELYIETLKTPGLIRAQLQSTTEFSNIPIRQIDRIGTHLFSIMLPFPQAA